MELSLMNGKRVRNLLCKYNYVQFLGHLLAIPEELDTAILSDKAYAMGLLKFDTDGGMISQRPKTKYLILLHH
ncbi:hypothetical protein H8356DRAFT_1436177 [Neocallimastix lanati (nom. inval.)]|nr:hypothetical protein H8356DRAFT_1436177 [Neocallimastix sp. JGI-2020a]